MNRRKINFIPLAEPFIKGNAWAYIKECLDTNWVSYVGSFVDRFEKDLAHKAGAKYAVATASGTASLHVALLQAGVKANEEVVMPGITFIAPANAIRYCGAWPVFTDVRMDDWQWDLHKLEHFLSKGCESRQGGLFNKITGRRVAALLPVHLLGGMCDVDAVAELATRYELPIIEDAAECMGATYKERPIGAAIPDYEGPSRLVITSFNGNKIMTTGGGGAIFTDDAAVAARIRHITTTSKADKIEFYHDEIGYNYRLSNIAAALGVAQLECLDEFVESKRKIASCYADALRCLGLTPAPEPRYCRSTYWMYSVLLGGQASPVIKYMNSHGIGCRPLWKPIASLPPYKDAFQADALTNVWTLYNNAISLPCSTSLSSDAMSTVISTLRDALKPESDDL